MAALRDRRTWELTKNEFVHLASQPSAPKSREKLRDAIVSLIEQRRRAIRRGIREEIIQYQEVPDDLFERIDPTRIAITAHYHVVKEALSAGLTVPWRAVKDYEDLCRFYKRHISGAPKSDLSSWLALN